MSSTLAIDQIINLLKTIAETTRLRILILLSGGDLTVSDLTRILKQSQPRVSRHLKILHEGGLIDRYQEGAWAYFRLSDDATISLLNELIKRYCDPSDPTFKRDTDRLAEIKFERQQRATQYFSKNAQYWHKIRSLHVSESAIEQRMQQLIGDRSFQAMLDIGTGTGSLLKLFASHYLRGVGVDINRDMLEVARVNLDKAGINHAQVRQGDITALPIERETFDLVTIYQVLHFLADPQIAIREAARVMRPGAQLFIVDFASHNLEFLRLDYAHLRLGFSDQQMEIWLEGCGLKLVDVESFPPKADKTRNRTKSNLTVKMWLARDPRQLIA